MSQSDNLVEVPMTPDATEVWTARRVEGGVLYANPSSPHKGLSAWLYELATVKGGVDSLAPTMKGANGRLACVGGLAIKGFYPVSELHTGLIALRVNIMLGAGLEKVTLEEPDPQRHYYGPTYHAAFISDLPEDETIWAMDCVDGLTSPLNIPYLRGYEPERVERYHNALRAVGGDPFAVMVDEKPENTIVALPTDLEPRLRVAKIDLFAYQLDPAKHGFAA